MNLCLKPLGRFGRRAAAGMLILCAAVPCGAEQDIRRDATVEAIERVMPSVVNIATERLIERHDFYDQLLREYYGRSPTQKSISLGSGVIIDPDGYLLTNLHVVNHANRVQVKLWNGREYEADPIIATPGSDVALVKIRGTLGEKFTAIKFAQDDDLLLGETVLALGDPFGLGGSVTRGILSSKNRRPANGDEPLDMKDWLVTDAAINPGNSGGPLVNLRGELIGLNVSVSHEQEGMGLGFSIPIKQVAKALSHFFTPEWTDSLWFGARFNAGAGPLNVTLVEPGSPAANAGLREGDELLQIDGQDARGLITANHLLCAGKDRDHTLTVRRGSEQLSVAVHLLPLAELIRLKLGLALADCPPQTAARLGLAPGASLLIDNVEKNGPADRARLQPGYLLTNIDGENAGKLQLVAQTLSERKSGDSVRLSVIAPLHLDANYVESRQGTLNVVVR